MIKLLIFSFIIWLSIFSHIHAETYIREYTYKASEVDSKISSRINAIDQVKAILLEEIGVIIRQKINIRRYENGATFANDDIEAITAGLTKLEILNEKWNGETYYLKVKLDVNPKQVLNALESISREKTDPNRQQLELLKDNERKLKMAHVETNKLRQQLRAITNITKREKLIVKYMEQVDQISISNMFNNGYNSSQQGMFQQAIYWFNKAANHGEASAQFNLGILYDRVKRNYPRAVFWYRKAAMQGMENAQYNLASMYNKGDGVKQDYAKAIYWYAKAAEQGHALAQYSLGLMYRKGKGVERDDAQAILWYHKAANQGIADAQYNLGFLHSHKGALSNIGDNIKQDFPQSIYWYRKAAAQGLPIAQLHLGIMYFEGINVPQNENRAKEWFQKACNQNNETSCLFLRQD